MLLVYAVDPAAVALNWQTCNQLISLFGFHKGRVLNVFPREWWGQVDQAINKNDSLRDIERQRIKTKTRRCLEKAAIISSHSYNNARTWVENAVSEHTKQPFDGVISTTPKALANWLLAPDELDEDHLALRAETEKIVLRTPIELASVVARLLLYSRQIVFVDPHFDPYAPRYQTALKAFLNVIARANIRPTRLEYHVLAKDGKDDLDAPSFRRGCVDNASKMIPYPPAVSFFRWREKYRGMPFPELHARYILTNRGGMKFDGGLDSGQLGQATPVSFISPEVHKIIWDSLKRNSEVYELEPSCFRISSSGYIDEI